MRTLSLFFCCLLLAGGAAAAAPKQQLTTALENLARSKETEAELKQRLAESERDMEKIRARASTIGERLQLSERRVTSQEAALAGVNAQIVRKREEFGARKDDYGKTVISLLRLQRLPPTAVFSAGRETQTLLQTASVLEKTNRAVARKAAQLRADIAQLHRLQSTAERRDASTRAEKEILRAEQHDLARELVARQKLQARLNADHARAEEDVARLSRESQSLQELLHKLEASEQAQRSRAQPSKATARLRNFDGKKGSARAPVAGDILHRFGDTQKANGTYRGMVFKARAGATVVAPYDGSVVFTGPFRDYGNMVLIKHKNGYISLIAGLGKVQVALSQATRRGEPIGTMPESGPAEAYVELRDAGAKPIDPADWFANVVGR